MNVIQVILGFFGYAKIPLEAIQLIEKVIYDLNKPDPPLCAIKDALIVLKDMLRSARKLSV